jgi:phenylalanyl-tRNA synthetase alpha chain
MAELEAIEGEALARVGAATSTDELRAIHGEILGKRSPLNGLRQSLGQLDVDERKKRGQEINEARARIEAAFAARQAELRTAERADRLASERLDLTEVTSKRPRGSLNLITQTRDRLEDTFVAMGFQVAEGPEVETDWHNFEALNIPPAHPARSGFDTLYLDYGPPESTLVRPHTSPVQIRLMQEQRPPIYAVMPGRVYRKDTPEPRKIPNFSQIEALVVDRGITFGDMAGTIEAFTSAYFGPNIHSRLRPGSFPFTEPSAEYEVTCTICEGAGCRTCSGTGWIELGGCGMVHPNVFRAVDIDPEEWSGFAFGFGIDRLAQMLHTIPDMRVMFDNDIRVISQF